MWLSAEALRVLGSLMEKEMVTPEAYPLSVNALIMACNQRSSRNPIMTLTDAEVRTAIESLQANDLVVPARDGGRVQKFEHRIRTVLNLRRDETAILCLLMLRGPQTPGELRSRSERMFTFDELGQLQSTLDRLALREQPCVFQLPRRPGSRETRWSHLLGDAPSEGVGALPAVSAGGDVSAEDLFDKIARLDARVAAIEARLRDLEPPEKG